MSVIPGAGTPKEGNPVAALSSFERKLNDIINAKGMAAESAVVRCYSLKEQTERLKQQKEKRFYELKLVVEQKLAKEKELEGLKQLKRCLDTQVGPTVQDLKAMEDVKLQLNFYKQLTGLQFDYNAPKEILSGFVRTKADGQKGLPTPFMLDKNNSNIVEQLWGKIGEATCNEELTAHKDDFMKFSVDFGEKLTI